MTGNFKTIAVTDEQFREIVKTIASGYMEHRPNPAAATALILERNLGVRISDIVCSYDYKTGDKIPGLKLSDIVRDGDRYRLDIKEQKTGKARTFTVPDSIYMFLENYCLKNGIKPNAPIFTVTTRAVQKALKAAAEYLELDRVGTHSFRKAYATEAYKNSGNDIEIVRRLLQHSSATTTQNYIGIEKEAIESTISKTVCIPAL